MVIVLGSDFNFLLSVAVNVIEYVPAFSGLPVKFPIKEEESKLNETQLGPLAVTFMPPFGPLAVTGIEMGWFVV